MHAKAKSMDKVNNGFHSSLTEYTPLLSYSGSKPPGCCGARHLVVFLAFVGTALAFCQRVNMSIAIVAMVNTTSEAPLASTANNTSSSNKDVCPYDHTKTTSTSNKKGAFNWDSEVQGMILSAFFWGYAATQIPGGLLSKRYGGKIVLGIGTLVTSIFTLLTPVAAWLDTNLLIAVRACVGLGQGVTFPAVHSLLAQWAPAFERSRFVGIVFAGGQVGTVIAMPLSGILADTNFLNGWPSVFYVFGAAGVVWFVFWMVFVYENPSMHPSISRAERAYITRSNNDDNSMDARKNMPIPWKSIWTSMPVWAIVVAHIGQNWGFNTLLTEMPLYMTNILHFDIKQNSFLSALPYLCMAIFSPSMGIVADWLRREGILTTTTTRKIMNTISHWLPACALIAASYTGCDRVSTVALLTVAVCLNGACRSGFQTNHLDISPNFAGILMGVSNCAANLASVMAPIMVGYLTGGEGEQTLSQWRIVFFVAAIFYIVTNAFYLVFASGDEQPWNEEKKRLVINNNWNKPHTSASSNAV